MVGTKLLMWFYLFVFLTCFQFRDFKVLDASSVKFEGGRERSGSGIQYRIWLKTYKNSDKLEIIAVWVDQVMYNPRILVDSDLQNAEGFQKGDTLLLTFTEWIHKPELGDKIVTESTTKEPPPGKFKGEGIIEGKIGRKTFYKEIDHFRKLDPKEYK